MQRVAKLRARCSRRGGSRCAHDPPVTTARASVRVTETRTFAGDADVAGARIRGFVNNVFDTTYATTIGSTSGNDIRFNNDPRMAGVRPRMDF
jgi:hypothetical protein